MKRLLLLAMALTIALFPQRQAMALTCPDEEAIHAAITKYIVEDYWSPGQRDIWKIADVRGFSFGPIKTGKIIRKDMDFSGVRDVCPARIEFEFTVVRQDSGSEVTRMGKGKVFYFFLDEFGEWTFKIG